MLGLRSHLINPRITTSLQRNGINSLLKNQGVGNTIQYVKRTTFFTTRSLHLIRRLQLCRTFDNNFGSFSLSKSPKLVPKSLIYQYRPFHATQPARANPVLLVFTTANAAVVIRSISNLLLSFLPF